MIGKLINPKIDINDLLNPDKNTDDEEKEGETIPVYCFLATCTITRNPVCIDSWSSQW